MMGKILTNELPSLYVIRNLTGKILQIASKLSISSKFSPVKYLHYTVVGCS